MRHSPSERLSTTESALPSGFNGFIYIFEYLVGVPQYWVMAL
jgi:hypothetical protein